MANFRCERLFVVLDEPVPGLDHVRAVDPVEFAWLGTDAHAGALGVTPLSSFAFLLLAGRVGVLPRKD